MAAYAGAGFGRVGVDKRATVVRQGGRYSRQRVAANDVVSVVIFLPHDIQVETRQRAFPS